ncbi:MOSC domain-containing protein [Algicella marina]|uniref:MOSC domain-containing protein n=1 Tax=Algicella marina TaxID=2683284 RepID=A0A6P1SZD3_9RHOB|nr:MOSC domain-containing protein [Algicella marina]QHQ35828.1 MOSC domain-containing protein [Algicella marina]
MRLAQISRYPIKAIGVEDLDSATLEAGQRLAGDRLWAVAHEAAKAGPQGWAACRNFIRGASSPRLMAITCETRGDAITLRHPDQPDITVTLPADAGALIAWLAPLADPGRAAPDRLVAAPEGMTDQAAPWLSILSQSSLDALSKAAGHPMARARFRANLWLEGGKPWEEFDWVGKHLRIGDAELRITEPITRCTATHADPATGERDTDTLQLLEQNWGHRDFGVFAEVTRSGSLQTGDTVEPLP